MSNRPNTSKKVTLKSRWQELCTPERWKEWLRLAEKDNPEVAAYWSDTDGCDGCIHLSGSFCLLQSLPCCCNPILTMRHGMIGMACMGAGYEPQSINEGAD